MAIKTQHIAKHLAKDVSFAMACALMSLGASSANAQCNILSTQEINDLHFKKQYSELEATRMASLKVNDLLQTALLDKPNEKEVLKSHEYKDHERERLSRPLESSFAQNTTQQDAGVSTASIQHLASLFRSLGGQSATVTSEYFLKAANVYQARLVSALREGVSENSARLQIAYEIAKWTTGYFSGGVRHYSIEAAIKVAALSVAERLKYPCELVQESLEQVIYADMMPLALILDHNARTPVRQQCLRRLDRWRAREPWTLGCL